MKLNKDVLMKAGIVAAVALVLYLIYRSRSCKDTYADYVADDDYAENMYEPQAADYAEEDYAEEAYGDNTAGDPQSLLMESTMDDDQANAMFEPEM